jgi:hypothetical protein
MAVSPIPRWRQLRIEIAALEDSLRLARKELTEIQEACKHPNLPKRGQVEEYMDTCPDCWHVSYQYAI